MRKSRKKYALIPQDLPYQRLAFLLDFIYAAQVDFDKVGEITGTNRTTVYHWLRRDDTRLSYANKIVKENGYTLTVALVRDSEETTVINISDIPGWQENNYELHPLAFLEFALKKYGVSKVQLADMLGMSKAGVNQWWKSQDILISRIYQIADVLNCSVRFFIVSNNEDNFDKVCRTRRVATTEIILRSTVDLGPRRED